jgi:hypothetical protein
LSVEREARLKHMAGEMELVNIAFAIMAIGGIGVVAALALFKTLDDKFPPISVDVYDRGVKQSKVFRLWGETIVENNIFRLLVNDFSILGDSKQMEFDMTDSPGFFGLGGGLKRRYRAYRRSDYLFGIKKYETVTIENQEGKRETIELTKLPPRIIVESADGTVTDKIKVSISKDGILVPLQIIKVNEMLTEFEVTNGKSIASRFIDNQKSNKLYLEATNPIVNTLLYSLPLIAIVLANGVVLYLISNTILTKLVEVTALLSKINP